MRDRAEETPHPPRLCRLAVASLLLATILPAYTLGLFLVAGGLAADGWMELSLLSLVGGLVTGIMALRRIARAGRALAGRRYAIAGITLSAALLASVPVQVFLR